VSFVIYLKDPLLSIAGTLRGLEEHFHCLYICYVVSKTACKIRNLQIRLAQSISTAFWS